MAFVCLLVLGLGGLCLLFFPCFEQESQYYTEGCIDLASDTIYFGYRSILVYRFGFIAILYN